MIFSYILYVHLILLLHNIDTEDELIELSQGKRARIEEIDADIDQLDGEQGAQAGEEIAYLTKERRDILVQARMIVE